MKFLNVGSSNSTSISMSLSFVSSPLTKEPKKPMRRSELALDLLLVASEDIDDFHLGLPWFGLL